VVIGAWRRVPDDISNLGMVMSFNGVPVQIGSSAAILGHPLRALVSAARLAGEQGVVLEPGWIVMAGAATAAEALKADLHVMLEAEQLGTVEMTTTAKM
jgi:2-oxo-3-hexenedioate decarboxylase